MTYDEAWILYKQLAMTSSVAGLRKSSKHSKVSLHPERVMIGAVLLSAAGLIYYAFFKSGGNHCTTENVQQINEYTKTATSAASG